MSKQRGATAPRAAGLGGNIADQVLRRLRAARSSAGRRELAVWILASGSEVVRRRLLRPSPRARLDEVTLLTNLVTKQSVGVIVALGIPDLIAAGTTRVAAVAEAVGADPCALGRVLRHLAARGILELDGSVVRLSDAGELLRSDHPESRAGHFHPGSVTPRLEAAVGGLAYSVTTGGPAFAHVHGEELWELVARDRLVASSFDREMAEHAHQIAPSLIENYDWSGVSAVADVGGGTGELLRNLLQRHPSMRGTLVEFADAASRARRAIAREDLVARCEVVEANFLEGVPVGADVYLLSWILHDWDDEHAEQILRNCRTAAGRGGRVLVIEQPFDVTANTELDLRMLVYFGGRERTRAEYEALAARAGLLPGPWTALSGGFCLLELRAAGAS